ncbi:MAG: hypothetical protein C5B49_09165 [Bdellovibrio sp.]|nr:MAG: hypothetical protein C5B49_09165 [Bdellovibrio sp.]
MFEDFIMDPNHRSSEMEERWINHAETDVFAFFLEEFGKENLPVPMEQAYPSRQFIAFLEKPAPEPSLPDSRNKIGQSIRNFLTRVFRKF